MLLPSPEWLNSGNNAWQLAAATFVGLQSIPGLTILYGGIVKKKWAINSAFMSMYAFCAVLLVWLRILSTVGVLSSPSPSSRKSIPGKASSI